MIRGRNIVCVASSWFDHPTSKHHVMRLLSEQNNVLWVNFHASRRPQLTASDTRLVFARLARAWSGPQRVAPNIDVLSPLLIPMPESPLVRRLNAIALSRQIRAALRRFPTRPVQLWLFTPDVPEVIRPLRPERIVYYCVDDFAAFDGYNTALMERLERQTMAASDAVITTSDELYRPRRAQHANVHFVPHGVDYEHFASTQHDPQVTVAAELQHIPRPIFGYMGLISDYVDLDLIAAAARARPAWSFVLLGDARCSLEAVANLPNVHCLGGRPYEDLPGYCRGFDVGLIAFRMNRLTRAVNPIKLREYLAAGLPVISSPMREVLPYAPAVQTAETLDEFLAAGEQALALAQAGAAATRQALVQQEGWRARVELLSRIVSGETEQTPAAAANREQSMCAGDVAASELVESGGTR